LDVLGDPEERSPESSVAPDVGYDAYMHAVVIDKFNEAGSVREIPEPTLDRHSVLVRIAVAGVNPIDWKVRGGHAGERPFPLVLGQDFAGVIERVGDSVGRVKPGDRVFGVARAHGSYAELSSIPDFDKGSPFAKIPDGIDDAEAAALPTPGLTALASLDILGVGEGTDLLIVGAAGAVGGAAVQMARKRGARITAVVRPGQSADARGFGADAVVESAGDFLEPVRAKHPKAFAAVLDLVSNGDSLQRHLPLYAKGAKLVTTLHVADEDWFRERGIEAVNVVLNETEASSPRGLETLAELVLAGDLRIPIAQERPLPEAATVLDQIEAGKLGGKIVLRVN
jgi:NADPH:quinone reductase-like Zn-dependent oxidoreductase